MFRMPTVTLLRQTANSTFPGNYFIIKNDLEGITKIFENLDITFSRIESTYFLFFNLKVELIKCLFFMFFRQKQKST